MKAITTLPNLAAAFEKMKEAAAPVTCTGCGNRYHNPSTGGSNWANLPLLVKCWERPNNMEAYPFYGCPVCGTDDRLK